MSASNVTMKATLLDRKRNIRALVCVIIFVVFVIVDNTPLGAA